MDHTITITIPYADDISNFDVAKAIMKLCDFNTYLDPTAIATMLLTEEEARTQRELRCVGACMPKEKLEPGKQRIKDILEGKV